MPENQNINYVSFISRRDYASDRKRKVPPAELTDEFYNLRHIFPPRMRTSMHYAIDALVSVEYVEHRNNHSFVRYQLAETDEIEPTNRLAYDRTCAVQPDGIMFVSFAQKSLFRRAKERRSELGYFMSIEQDWEELLLDVSQKQPKNIS